MFNPSARYAESNGIDLPILYCYLAGRISGDNINECLGWRESLVRHYKHYAQDEFGNKSYPISFLCPLNSGESSSVDAKGLTSSIPPNLIYDKDFLSVKRADVIVANMDDFFEVGIERLLHESVDSLENNSKEELIFKLTTLQKRIINRRPNLGTISEVAWALYLNKPLILIVPEAQKVIFEKHPFTRRASVIVYSEQQLIREKWLNKLYKSISSAVYDD